VVGLGRFGSALAEDLQRLGHDMMTVDASGTLVQLTHVVQADATSEAAVRQLGADGFPVAVVAIGTGIEASTRVGAGDLLIVSGATRLVEKSAAETGG
jgi:trk system potassium uptake protein TrkA